MAIGVGAAAKRTPGAVRTAVRKAQDPEFRAQVREDYVLVRDVVRGKVKERFAPLVSRLAHRA